MKELLAYHGKEDVKQKYVARMKAHIAADELIHGEGWNGSKGCAVGCTLNRYDHACYQNELGLPEWLAKLEDTLFENMSKEKSKTFPLELLQAIPIGKKDWNKTLHKFCIFILEDSKKNVQKQFDYVIKAIDLVIDYHLKSIVGFESGSAAWSARSAALSARSAWSAWSAALSAWSARSAALSARSAALSAWSAWSARSAALSARSAAESAAWSAALSAWSARSAALSAAFDRYADYLIELLKETDVTDGISKDNQA